MNHNSARVALLALFLSCLTSGADTTRAWEGTLELPTYRWHDDPNPVFSQLEDAIYYPYTRQDLIEKETTPRRYRAVFLENEYLRVTCLPELGGRIFSVFDKTTGEEMFHTNREIKPALIAMRGAWISGGIEWNTGPHGHTVTAISPVDVTSRENDDGSVTLVIGNTEMIFRTRWNVQLTLHPGKAYLDEEVRIFNPTDGTHPYYFWNCTAFPNLPGTRFIYPMTLGTDHNGTAFFGWPFDDGVDMTWLKNYPTMSSVFAYACDFDFFGAYDVDLDRGIVSYANHHVVRGKKAWTWGKDDFGVVSQMALSDAGPVHAQYIEVQSGPLLTQSDYGMLAPHEEIAWREYWYPVHGLGDGFEFATRDAAVQTIREDDTVRVGVYATGDYEEASIHLTSDGRTLLSQAVQLTPLEAVWVSLTPAPEGAIDISLSNSHGRSLLEYTTPLAVPQVEEPDLAELRARPDGQFTADELYAKARLSDSQSDPGEAEKRYLAVLEADPLHEGALHGLATLALEEGRFEDALGYLRSALKRNEQSGTCWYLLGVVELALGHSEEALACRYRASVHQPTRALGLDLVGRSHMRRGKYELAEELFSQAYFLSPRDTSIRNHWLAARHAAAMHDATSRNAAAEAVKRDPVDYVSRALAALCAEGSLHQFAAELRKTCGEIEFTATETALFFADLGMPQTAIGVMVAVYPDPTARPIMVDYYLGYFAARMNDEKETRAYLKQTAGKPTTYVMPSRTEALDALKYVLARQPRDASAHLLMGHTLAGLRRIDEALPHWRRAVALDPSLAVGQRILGLYAWREGRDLKEAEARYRVALKHAPDDQLLYRDLAKILEQQGRREDALGLIEDMPTFDTPRSDIILWQAETYVKQERYDDCLALLARSQFDNREGGSRPHNVFADALLARGLQRYREGAFQDAAADFRRALTYPENLMVGKPYHVNDAEIRYWLGSALLATGDRKGARAEFEAGGACKPSDSVHVERCKTALALLDAEAAKHPG